MQANPHRGSNECKVSLYTQASINILFINIFTNESVAE